MEVKHSTSLNKAGKGNLSMTKQEYEVLYEQYQEERNKVAKDPWRLHYHLMPESGWLNDPNGLCQYHGVYHIYYQYSPFDVEGKTKLWGHMSSRDMINFQQEEPVLFPDHRVDERGVYSGSAFIEQDQLYFYYTGNVKLEDKVYDYINEGREQNTVLVESKDGVSFSEKKWLMSNSDYPEDMSCHIRDPKVFKKNGQYYMVLGARDKASKGCVLLYQSTDLYHWTYHMRIASEQVFGYMWECPDFIELQGKQFLITCPQGVAQLGYEFANVHQCGYFPISLDVEKKTYQLDSFVQLDRGFDFYAPQSFVDEQGRRILIGWMGLPDIEYQNPTCEKGWQHALTIPRQLTEKNGRILQQPLEEMRALRKNHRVMDGEQLKKAPLTASCFELKMKIVEEGSFVLQLRKGAWLRYEQQTHTLTLSFEACGYGRDQRSVVLTSLRSLQIFADTSSFEIFVNEGEEVFTSRVYTKAQEDIVAFEDLRGAMQLDFYELNGYQIK